MPVTCSQLFPLDSNHAGFHSFILIRWSPPAESTVFPVSTVARALSGGLQFHLNHGEKSDSSADLS